MKTIEEYTSEQIASAFPVDLKDRTPLDLLDTLTEMFNDLAQQPPGSVTETEFHTLYQQIKFYINLIKADHEKR